MYLLLTLFRRELAPRPRQGNFYVWRLLLGGLTGLLVLLVYSIGMLFIWDSQQPGPPGLIARLFAPWQQQHLYGLLAFTAIGLLTVAIACLFSPFAGASALGEERRQRTLPLLLLTELTVTLVVLGKLLASLARMALVILVVLPLFILCISLGGVSATQIMLGLALLAATIFFGNSLGLAIGAACRRENQVTGLVGLGMLAAFGLPPLLVKIAARHYPLDELAWRVLVSPLEAMVFLCRGEQLHLVARACLVLMAAAIPCIVVAIPLVHRQLRLPELPPVNRRALLRRDRLPFIGKRLAGRRLFSNPLLWREFDIVHGGLLQPWAHWLVAAAITAFVVIRGSQALGISDPLTLRLRVYAALYWMSMLLGLVSLTLSASRMFSRERSGRTLESLLCTDLLDRDIVGAKLAAAYLGVLPWLVGMVASLALLIASLPTALPAGAAWFLGFSLAGWAALLYGYSGLCMYLSLRLTQQVELIAALCLVGWLTLGQLITALLIFTATFAAFLVGPFLHLLLPIAVGIILRRQVLRELRHQALP